MIRGISALQVVEELAASRLEEMKTAAYNRARNKIRKEQRNRSKWDSLTKIVSEVSRKYPICVENVQFPESSNPYFSFLLNDRSTYGRYGKFNIHFVTEENGRVSLRYSDADVYSRTRTHPLADANTVEELIPSLISKLADVVISRR